MPLSSAHLDSRSFLKLLRDAGVVRPARPSQTEADPSPAAPPPGHDDDGPRPRLTATDADLAFSAHLVPGGERRLGYGSFVAALRDVCARHAEAAEAAAQARGAEAGGARAPRLTLALLGARLARLGGKSLTGVTVPDPVKWHDDRGTYTGAHAARFGVPEAERGQDIARGGGDFAPRGGPERRASWKEAGQAVAAVNRLEARASQTRLRVSQREGGKTAAEARAGEALGLAKRAAAGEFDAVRPAFDAYTAHAGTGSFIDGRTFARLFRDLGLVDGGGGGGRGSQRGSQREGGGRRLVPADVDMSFAQATTQRGQRGLSFPEFVLAVDRLSVRAEGGLGADAASAVAAVAAAHAARGGGGPDVRGTVADSVPFHDDKDLYTGVHRHGGPSTNDLGTSDLTYIANRAPADVRGLNKG